MQGREGGREGWMEGWRSSGEGRREEGRGGEGRGRRALVKVILLPAGGVTALLLGLVCVHGGGLLLVECGWGVGGWVGMVCYGY